MQIEFKESEGEIAPEFLTVEYQLFREDLYALMGKPPAQPPAMATDTARSARVHARAYAVTMLIVLCTPTQVFPAIPMCASHWSGPKIS